MKLCEHIVGSRIGLQVPDDTSRLQVAGGPCFSKLEFNMNLRTVFAAAALAVTPALFSAPALAETVPLTYTAEDNNLAVGGFDTVSYFSGTPVEGSAEFTTTYQGAEYQFASQENLDTFLLEPAKFAPQFGGHCAYGAAKEAAFPGDPAVYAVVDGKLYLNLNSDVQQLWNADQAGYISTAEKNWPVLTGQAEEAAPAHGS